MNTNTGFREALLASSVTLAFHDRGFLCYPQFTFKNGAIDALFIKSDIVVLAEFKRLSYGSHSVVRQTRRMRKFDAVEELRKHQFKRRKWKVHHLWVCDAWERHSVDWWMGKKMRRAKVPFDGEWERGCTDFQKVMLRHGTDWDPYSIVWAHRKP
jgi:hypothetical protein